MIDASQIGEHMEAVGSDGQPAGTMDKLAIKLTRKHPAAQGEHHIIDIEAVQSVEHGKLMLTMPATEAIAQEKTLRS